MANPKTWRDLFDFSDSASVQGAIKVLNAINKSYNSLIQTAVKGKTEITNANKALVASLDAVEKETKSLDETNKKDQQTTAKRNAELLAMNATYKKQADQIKFLNSQITKLTNERNAVSKKTKDLNNINKEAIALEAKLGKLTGESAKQNAALRLQVSELRKVRNQEAKETAGLVTIYDKQVARLNKLTKEYKAVAFEEGIASKRAKELSASLTTLRTKITNVEQSAGQFQRGVGGYRQALTGLTAGFRQLAGALGFTGLIFGVVSALRKAAETVVSFQKENAVLAGVLGKTQDEIKELNDDAKRLGATTAKTATDVVKLQQAYARLGFTQSEILDLTKDTIDGSIALNASLEETAELTGAVVRTFDDLSTTDADEILDVLTLSTQKSALQFDKLRTALPIVSGAANAAGVSFTNTVALLGKLSDAGIDASSSATALRNIFIESASQGLNYQQILDRISNSQDKLTAANDEFGKRAAVSGSILANLSSEVKTLDTQLQNAGGTAEKVANEQLNTITGDVNLLTSAWQGWILSIDSGDGAISRFVRGSLQGLTDLLTKINSEVEGAKTQTETLFDNLKDGALTVEDLDIELAKLNATITASGRAASKQREQIIGQTMAIEEAKQEYQEWLAVQQQGQALIDQGLGITELTQRLESLQSNVNNNTRGSKAFQEQQKALANEIIAVSTAIQILNADAKQASTGVEELNTATKDLNTSLSDSKVKLEEIDLRTVAGEAEDAARRIEEANKRANEGLAKQSEDLLKLVDKDNKARLRSFEENKKKEVEAARVAEEQKQVIQDTAFEAASLIGNQLVTNSNIRLENELVNLEKQKTFELELAGENSQKRAQIEEEFAEKEKAIKIKQAKNDKKQALFNIALNTAEAIVKVSAQTGILAPFAIPAIAAIGALQAGLVASQPLPAFEKGGIVDTDGPIITSEKGREMAVTPSGNLIMTGNKGPEVRTDIPKGSAILNNAITEGLLKKGFDQNEVNEDSASSINKVIQAQKDRHTIVMMQKMERENDILIQTLKGLKSDEANQHWGVSHGRLVSTMKRGSTRLHDWKSKNRD